MPIIPDYDAYRGGEHRPSVASPRSAGLVAEASAKLGEQAGRIAMNASDLVLKKREQSSKDLGEESRLAGSMTDHEDQHHRFRESNPDESTWEADLEARISNVDSEVRKMKGSPEARARTGAAFRQWSDGLRRDTAGQARAHAVTRARNESLKRREQMEKRGDFEGSRRQVAAEVEAGMRTGQEAEDEYAQIREREGLSRAEQEEAQEMARITNDPASWLAAQAPGKVPEGVSPIRYQRRYDHAVKTMAMVTAETATLIRDGIASAKVPSAEHVRSLASHLRPGTVDLLVKEFERQAAGTPPMPSPQAIHEMVGSVTAMMDQYHLDPDHYDEGYVKIMLEIGKLPEGPERKHLDGQLVRLREGKLKEVETAQDLAERTLTELYNDDLFGPVGITGKGKGVTRMAIDSGLLRDRDKLMKRGFTAEQAEEISGSSSPAAVFRRLHGGIAAKDANAPYDSSALDAIREYRDEFDWVDPQEEERGRQEKKAARIRLGKARVQIMEFARLNPKAQWEDFEKEIRRIEKGETLVRQAEEFTGKPELPPVSYYAAEVDMPPVRESRRASADGEAEEPEPEPPAAGRSGASDRQDASY